MSEQLPQFNEVKQNTYSTGAKHLYGVNEAGKLTHISQDAVLEAHGYSAAEAKQNRPLTEAEHAVQRDQEIVAEHAARATPGMVKTAKAMAGANKEPAVSEPAANPISEENQAFLAPFVAKATPKMRATAHAMVQGKPSKPAKKVSPAGEHEIGKADQAFLAPFVAKATPAMKRTAYAMDHGKYPEATSTQPEQSSSEAVTTFVPVVEVSDKAADHPRRTKQLDAENTPQDEYDKHDFSPEWDKDAVDGPDYSHEEYDFSLAWDGYDQVEGQDISQNPTLRQRVRNRWNDLKVRGGMLVSGNIKEALAKQDPEKERRVMKKLLLGATVVGMAGVAAVFIKRGDIDLIPTNGRFMSDGDGIGIDLAGIKLGNGTESHNHVADIVDALTPNGGGQSADNVGESLIPNRGSNRGASEQAAQTFTVEQGHGYTQEIRDLVPGRTPQQYLAAHNAALNQFGPDYIGGVDNYVMSNGDLGLHQGTGTMNQEVEDFLKNFLQ